MDRYKLNLMKDEFELDSNDIKNLKKEFEEKFLLFKKEKASDLYYVEALLEYADMYDLSTDLVGELASYSKIITDCINKNINNSKSIDIEEW